MLEIKNLTGGYVHVPVLKDVSFTVESGQLVGLIGLNGAGKSTTINEIIGLLTPYSGSININGLTLQEDATSYRKQIGYIPETPSLYEELTLREHIETVAMAYGIEQKVAFDRVEPFVKNVPSGPEIRLVSCSFFKRDEAEGYDYLCFCGGSKSFHRG